ncbi:hypothetical protein BOX15_Mlig018645g2, partial [Macrostomum lignano]
LLSNIEMLQAREISRFCHLIKRFAHNEAVFQGAKHGSFYQQSVPVTNPFDKDPFMQRYVKVAFGNKPAELAAIQSDLSRLGNRIATDVHELALDCERQPPTLEQFDCWGRRIDRIHTSHAWKSMKTFSAEEGFIALAYPSPSNGGGVVSNGRLHQMLKNLLYAPSSGLYGCPLAMTDGAAKTLRLLDERGGSGQTGCLSEAYDRLTTRDPKRFWTSGQWMTERGGGSDVGDGTETVAVPQDDGTYRLYGFKWFSSATDSDMTLALARVVPNGSGGAPTPGSRGLSLFFIRVRSPDNPDQLNGIQVVRLKNKLGTRQLPTAELLLDGCRARLIGEPGRGVAEISTMLQLTRLHNAVHAAGALRRFSQLCRDHARQRTAFCNRISEYPLHVRGLSDLEVHSRAACLFAMNYAAALGRTESRLLPRGDGADAAAGEDDQQLVRLLSPLLKLFTAKQAVRQAQEAMEMFGGVGYVEESGIPGMLRDANVLPIWEGTTNVLSLDLLRALHKSRGAALPALQRSLESACSVAGSAPSVLGLSAPVDRLRASYRRVLTVAAAVPADRLTHAAREFAYSLSRLHCGAQLLQFAAATGHSADAAAARRWCLASDFDQFVRVVGGHQDGAAAEDLLCAEEERRVVFEDESA